MRRLALLLLPLALACAEEPPLVLLSPPTGLWETEPFSDDPLEIYFESGGAPAIGLVRGRLHSDCHGHEDVEGFLVSEGVDEPVLRLHVLDLPNQPLVWRGVLFGQVMIGELKCRGFWSGYALRWVGRE